MAKAKLGAKKSAAKVNKGARSAKNSNSPKFIGKGYDKTRSDGKASSRKADGSKARGNVIVNPRGKYAVPGLPKGEAVTVYRQG